MRGTLCLRGGTARCDKVLWTTVMSRSALTDEHTLYIARISPTQKIISLNLSSWVCPEHGRFHRLGHLWVSLPPVNGNSYGIQAYECSLSTPLSSAYRMSTAVAGITGGDPTTSGPRVDVLSRNTTLHIHMCTSIHNDIYQLNAEHKPNPHT